MSAFIVSTRCMNRCVSTIWAVEPHFDGCQTQTELGNKLYAMNQAAVFDRYAHRNDIEGAPIYTHSDRDHLMSSPAASFKSLTCLRYQCWEGDVPNSPLYLDLERVMGRVSARIVAAMPAYEAAPWG